MDTARATDVDLRVWEALLSPTWSLSELITRRFGRRPDFELLAQRPLAVGAREVWERVSSYLLAGEPVSLHLVRLDGQRVPSSLLAELARGASLKEVLDSRGWARRGLSVKRVARLPSALREYLGGLDGRAWFPAWVRRFWAGEGDRPAVRVWEVLPWALWLGRSGQRR